MAHEHIHAHNKKLLDRMSRIVGHTASIKTMIEEKRDCTEVLIQIAAVRAALNSVGKLLLNDHINHCVLEAIKNEAEDTQMVVDDLTDAIDKFVR